MMELITWRQRYTVFFVAFLLCISFYILSQGLKGGTAQFDENLPGRKYLIEIFTRTRLKLGDRVFNQALVGKDGWLVYTGTQNLDSFQNTPTLPPGGIENIQHNLELLYTNLQKRNITLIVVIAPNPATIYPDKLPDEIQKIGSRSELELLADEIQKKGPPVLLDLRPALQKARLKQDVYYRTNTHWNSNGVFVAYREIMRTLALTYPELAPKKMSDFDLHSDGIYPHDIPQIMGATHILEAGFTLKPKNDDLKWIIYQSNDPRPMSVSYSAQENLPKLLMYGDSFGEPLVPLLAPHFSRATFIHNVSLSADVLSYKEIEAADPDIVVLEFVERNLQYLNGWLQNYGVDFK